MFDVGFSEILLTSGIALIVLGPERLPKVARQVGNWMGRARAMARQLTDQLEREVNAEELMRETRKSTRPSAPISSEPAPYDVSAMPKSTPDPAVNGHTPSPPGVYSADPASAPHGADWQPTQTEHAPRND
jgi:sec-independent protein translocase protein TatB